ncbi:Cas10/Cmr2 second palm domain-containing protein [Saprospira grandis]|uniref:Cas10/Cmr2 second palm domain-containing protein n=1 Tax=Saprospira grandis (strain Lewin) TaxID=984262 RepID=H6L9L7_SAPGL|nr:hypothetical protein [Saprospira grandis]AFC23195.1 hypothetical protein SGRA_0456 [Saprospira grandis str. Lewin]
MDENVYLYAAAVQGIQSFIFETNKLKEIAGASELVAKVSDSGEFIEFLKSVGVSNPSKKNFLIAAAGNIKYIFDSKEDCEKAFREFPYHIAEKAPGITISQAVLPIKRETIGEQDIHELENQLKAERNRPMRPNTLSWMITARVPETGRPALGAYPDGEVEEKDSSISRLFRSKSLNLGRYRKLQEVESSTNSLLKKSLNIELKDKVCVFAKELKRICPNEGHSWLAMIHADGNDLGRIIPKLFKGVKGQAFRDKQIRFSKALDDATRQAVQKAFTTIFRDDKKDVKSGQEKGKALFERYYKEQGNAAPILGIRPVVIGGDDLSIMVPAEIALDFTKAFLEEFQKETKKELTQVFEEGTEGYDYVKNGLTACAGIAYVTEKFPFHYSADLAESLCSYTKKVAKAARAKSEKNRGEEDKETILTPASLSFYKLESSYAKGYSDYLKEELLPAIYAKKSENNKNKGVEGILNDRGALSLNPYFLAEKPLMGSEAVVQQATVDELSNRLEILSKSGSLASRLRRVLSMLYTHAPGEIQFELERIATFYPKELKGLGINLQGSEDVTDKIVKNCQQLHDLLSLHSFSKFTQEEPA